MSGLFPTGPSSSPSSSSSGSSSTMPSAPQKPSNAERRARADWPPLLKVYQPPPGSLSPQVDERCVTYCSQTSHGRSTGNMPWCRTLCLRHVFFHEVKRIVGRPKADALGGGAALVALPVPATEARSVAQLNDAARAQRANVVYSAEHKHIPLPPEGQDPSAIFERAADKDLRAVDSAASAGPVSASRAMKRHRREQRDAGPASSHAGADGRSGDAGAKDGGVRYWEEGTYVWYTKHKWHSLDHLNSMMLTLEQQAGWERYRERMRAEFLHRQRVVQDAQRAAAAAAVRRAPIDAPPARGVRVKVKPVDVRPLQDEFNPGAPKGRTFSIGVPNYPDVYGQALLVPVHSPFSLFSPYVDHLWRPTAHALALTRESFESGAQREFARRAWDKSVGAQWREPWQLMARAWDIVRGSGRGENE